MHLTGPDLFFWVLGLCEHCILLAVIWFRHRATQFPVFTALITANVVRTVVLYLTLRYGSSENYFYIFWTFGFLDVALQLAVAYELASHVFRPLGPWAPDVRSSFAALATVSLLVASVLTWLATPATRTLRSAIVIRGNFFSSALMTELLVALIALSVVMGYSWRTHVARLTQGFGIYSAFGILTEGAHSYFGTGQHAYARVSWIRMSLYCLCVAYWIFSLAKNEPEPRKLPEQLRLELRTLQQRVATLLQGFRELGRPS
jgi:hypothetical protein